MQKVKLPVSRRAFEARMRRYFSREKGSELRKSRTVDMVREYGEYYLVDQHNHICGPGWLRTLKDLEDMGREAGVLREYEEVTS
jgi:hypothetical protein